MKKIPRDKSVVKSSYPHKCIGKAVFFNHTDANKEIKDYTSIDSIPNEM